MNAKLARLSLLVSTWLGVAGALAADGAASPSADFQYHLPGLEQPATISVDYWGIPHIYANTHYDAFFVQGFNAARDRLWQIDLWRRRGLGQLAEVLGESYAEQDRAARLFLYRGDMYREWLAYGSDAKQIAEAFTNGINAFVALLKEQPGLMPPEFGLLGYEPSIWQASDIVRIRSHGLWRNVVREVTRARITCSLGLDASELWKVLEPEWQATIPEGLDPCEIPEGVLDDYLLATAPVNFSALINAKRAPDQPPHLAIDAARRITRGAAMGSNNWAVAPERTLTGRPILADDPHRSHAVPSLRYIAHLSAPGLDIIGAGEPALPGISIGHNQRIAFGLTIFPIDQEDLYIYSKAPKPKAQKRRRGNETSKLAYLYQGSEESVRTVEETISIRNQAPRTVTLKFTRHGPVVFESDQQIFAVRAAWLEPGMAPYFGSIEYMRAQNWREFRAALNRWGAPSENQVFADIDGNIGYKPAGLFPRRTTWDGLLPVPGDGRYEWQGYFDMDALPEEFNPARGFTATANSMNLPKDYPIDARRVGFEWSSPWRYRRIWEVLEEQTNHSIADSHDLQRDYESVLARRVIGLLPPPTGLSHSSLWLLKQWDAKMLEESPGAALFAVWYYRHLPAALIKHLLPDAGPEFAELDSLATLRALQQEGAQQVAVISLQQAWKETVELLGENPDAWRWGDLHKISFSHPLASLADDDLAQMMAYTTYPRGGAANTVNKSGFDKDDFGVRSGASFRMVLDVGLWDDAEVTNAPGQSGDPRSPFYGNLLQGWATDSSIPLLYSRDAVEANEAVRIELLPATPAAAGDGYED
jgi:penicillin amidase